MKFLLILVTIIIVDAKPSEKCSVGEWGSWGEWTQGKNDYSGYSYPAPPRTEEASAHNRKNMDYIMQKMEDTKDERRRCLADGSCPQLAARASEAALNCVDGLAGNYSCLNVDMCSHISNSDLWGDLVNSPDGNDIWGWEDPVSKKEYAIVGMTEGTVFVDISDPYNVNMVAKVRAGTASTWRDIKVVNNTAFIISEALLTGIQVVDLTQLRTASDLDVLNPTKYNKLSRCHNIVSSPDSNTVFAVGCRNGDSPCLGGLHAVDVSDPANPEFAGCFSADGYTHDAECMIYDGPDASYLGREICFAYNEDSLTIVDVTNKAAMTQISRTAYNGSQYSHQGCATENLQVLLLDDELDEDNDASNKKTRTYIFDITDLTAPVLRNTYWHTSNSIDHNQYIIGDLTYQGNYASGLRILRIDEGTYDLTEVAYFDVAREYSDATFNGVWGVYPYFKSGVVVVNSIEEGLFVLKPDMTAIGEVTQIAAMRERKRDLLHLTDINSCPHLSEQEYR